MPIVPQKIELSEKIENPNKANIIDKILDKKTELKIEIPKEKAEVSPKEQKREPENPPEPVIEEEKMIKSKGVDNTQNIRVPMKVRQFYHLINSIFYFFLKSIDIFGLTCF